MNLQRRYRSIAVLVACLLFGATSAAWGASSPPGSANPAPNGWTLTDLGSFFPKDINNRGDMLGVRTTDNHYVFYTNGGFIDFGAVGAIGTFSPVALNDRAQIVGSLQDFSGLHQVIWENGSTTDLGTLRPFDIDNEGRVFAVSPGEGGFSVVAWKNGTIESIGDLPSGAVPTASGEDFAAGNYAHPGAVSAGWVMNDGVFQDLGSLGGGYTVVSDAEGRFTVGWSTIRGHLNDGCNGDICNDHSGQRHATLYAGGRLKDLAKGFGHHESYATAVNSHGVVVGYMHLHMDGSQWTHENRAFIYFGGAFHFLRDFVDTGRMVLGYPADINDSGQIVGYAPVTPKISHGFLLTPN